MPGIEKINKRCKRVCWISLLILAVAIQVVSFFPRFVEKYYSLGIYPVISKIQRRLTGWLPFSIGDIFYAVLIILLIIKIRSLVNSLRRNGLSKRTLLATGKGALFFILILYVVFYLFWGLNYSRVGISGQLKLEEKRYSAQDLDTLVALLHNRLNAYAAVLSVDMRDSFQKKKGLFRGAANAYKHSALQYPYLDYQVQSVKPSIYSYLGNYLGFQGYYNPFSGEAQVNTTIPPSVEPFVASHEIAHQLGYAKESEANFVGFLASSRHPSVNFRYSAYFDMYHYGYRQLFALDSMRAKGYERTLNPKVKADVKYYQAFYRRYRNPVEPFISLLYGYFLKANNQPKGRASYDEVVTWLIAWYKKNGKDAI